MMSYSEETLVPVVVHLMLHEILILLTEPVHVSFHIQVTAKYTTNNNIIIIFILIFFFLVRLLVLRI